MSSLGFPSRSKSVRTVSQTDFKSEEGGKLLATKFGTAGLEDAGGVTATGVGAELPPPPPQAASPRLAALQINRDLKVLTMIIYL